MTDTAAPYNILNDNILMLLFILNIVGISYVFLMNGSSIIERVKCIFYYESKSAPFNDRTHITRICNVLLYAQTILYGAMIASEYIQQHNGNGGERHTTAHIAILAAFLLLVILAKRIAYDIVINILFSKKEADEWRDLYLFTVKLAGFAMSPAIIAILFIPEIPFIYVGFYIILIFLLYIYTITSSLIRIIFHKKRNYLDIFLYLCALEFLPTAMVWKSVLQLNEFITTKI